MFQFDGECGDFHTTLAVVLAELVAADFGQIVFDLVVHTIDFVVDLAQPHRLTFVVVLKDVQGVTQHRLHPVGHTQHFAGRAGQRQARIVDQ